MTARSVNEPRTYATASASPIEIRVERISHGISNVSDGPSRVAMMCDTASLVLQLAPKSAVTTCWMKIHSCTYHAWSTPSCLRMLAICSALEILPASTYAGSPPTQLNRTNTSTITPSIVGIICQSRRMMYAYIDHLHRGQCCAPRIIAPSPSRRSVTLARTYVATASPVSLPDVDVLPLGVQDRVLLVPENVRLCD